LFLVRDPLQVLTAHENGIENVVAFLTDNVTALQLEQLAAPMERAEVRTYGDVLSPRERVHLFGAIYSIAASKSNPVYGIR
jgi:hypothetical protein